MAVERHFFMRGVLIVVEGVDRSGKSTQCARLGKELSGFASLRFPDRTTEIGNMISQYLKRGVEMSDQSIHLLYSANRWEKKEVIEKYLEDGVHVICDRYAYSGVAFSMAKGMDINWCKNPDRGLPAPDMVLFLELSPSAATSRPGFGDERYEVSEFQLKVRKAYSTLEQAETSPWVHINAENSLEEVYQAMVSAINSAVEQKKNSLLPPALWTQEGKLDQ